MRIPLDRADIGLIAATRNYKFGDPVPANPKVNPEALTIEQLRNDGTVGFYVDEKSFADPLFQRLTGWGNPQMLGPEWKPYGS